MRERIISETRTETEKPIEEMEKGEFRNFISSQILLPEDQWDERFHEYTERQWEENERISSEEESPEERRRRTFARYFKCLDLDEGDLRDKRIADLGCGAKGDFVRACLDRDLTREIYGLDIQINPDDVDVKYRDHLLSGDFDSKLPVENMDYVFSVGAIDAPIEEEEIDSFCRTLDFAIESLKEGGELRIPIKKVGDSSDLVGIKASMKNWEEALGRLSQDGKIKYRFEPVDVTASGKKKDVWLFGTLIIKRINGAIKDQALDK